VNWQYIIIHHSAEIDTPYLDYKSYYTFHTNVLKWCDIGYHVVNEEVTDNIINIFGRPLTQIGAHCRTMNEKAIGICFAGNFNEMAGPSDARLTDCVRRVILPLMAIYKIPLKNIRPHRDFARTDCPGKLFRFDALLKEIKNGI
jgi:hypothetical protein